jgi:hypothetical protein
VELRTDPNACIEITGGPEVSDQQALDAFRAQCARDPQTTFQLGGRPGPKGPTCMRATISSSGVQLAANVYWHPEFCQKSGETIDTRTTCTVDLKGDAEGAHRRDK